MLGRLSFPKRFVDMQLIFFCSEARLCAIFNWMIEFVYSKCIDMLYWDTNRLTFLYLSRMAAAISRKSGALDCCVGFIDGTVRAICRPSNELQEEVYNGHKVRLYMDFLYFL
jgi:hypothetical protein